MLGTIDLAKSSDQGLERGMAQFLFWYKYENNF